MIDYTDPANMQTPFGTTTPPPPTYTGPPNGSIGQPPPDGVIGTTGPPNPNALAGLKNSAGMLTGKPAATKPSGGNPTDPAYAAQLVAWYANQPGANPSLKNDPNYWIGQLTNGHLGTDENYIIQRFMQPEGAPAGGGTNLGNILQPFTGTFTPPQQLNLGGPPGISYIPPAPQLNLAPFNKPPAFELPTADEAKNDPGYDFRLKTGNQQLTNNAAATGLLRGGATLKDFINYGQDFASNEYGNVVSRDLQKYNTNYQTQYVDPYNFNTAATEKMFAPTFAGWQANATAGANQNQQNYSNAWNQYLQSFDQFKYNQQWPYTVLSDQQKIGLNASQ